MDPPVITRVSAAGAALCVLTLAATGRAHAGESPAPPGVVELRHNFRADVPIAAAAITVWAATEIAKKSLAPETCRWCSRDQAGRDTLNGLDRWARNAVHWSSPGAAAAASNVTAFAAAPLVGLGFEALAAHHDGRADEALVDMLIVAETTALATDLNQLVKLVAGRQRPYAHFADPVSTTGPDDNLSFYSGHTSFTFALATSAGTVASMRHYRWAPWVWACGLTVAGATGYLRMAADKHYFTDVATGAVLGSAIGIAIPRFAHGPRAPDLAVHIDSVPTAAGGGALLGLRGRW